MPINFKNHCSFYYSHFPMSLQAKVMNSEPIVYKPIIELQKICESTEIIIFRSFMKKN